ncbi:MAG: cytochrome C [Bacteroidia bacterium]|nr:cytochrome C [Bacteroidia bacterium]
MSNQSSVLLFMDAETIPFGNYPAPVHFELDTRKLTDGKHTLKIISKDPSGKEGIRIIPFVVRNGPAVAIEGLNDNEVVDGLIPIMINAYGKGDQKKFLIEGSETPHSIPAWLWATVIGFVGWGIYYMVVSMHMIL